MQCKISFAFGVGRGSANVERKVELLIEPLEESKRSAPLGVVKAFGRMCRKQL